MLSFIDVNNPRASQAGIITLISLRADLSRPDDIKRVHSGKGSFCLTCRGFFGSSPTNTRNTCETFLLSSIVFVRAYELCVLRTFRTRPRPQPRVNPSSLPDTSRCHSSCCFPPLSSALLRKTSLVPHFADVTSDRLVLQGEGL